MYIILKPGIIYSAKKSLLTVASSGTCGDIQFRMDTGTDVTEISHKPRAPRTISKAKLKVLMFYF
jgi:hypothetical protein